MLYICSMASCQNPAKFQLCLESPTIRIKYDAYLCYNCYMEYETSKTEEMLRDIAYQRFRSKLPIGTTKAECKLVMLVIPEV